MTVWKKQNNAANNNAEGKGSVTFLKLPEVGSIEGTFIESKEHVSQYGPFINHYFETEAEGKIGVSGFAALNRELENVEGGTLVKVDYLGKKESKAGRSYHAIDLFVADV